MPDIYLRKHGAMLAPGDENAEEIIARLKPGQAIKVKYTIPRNYANHRRFFAFLKITFDIQDHFDNIKHFRKWLIMKSGHYQIIEAPNGYKIFDADSIAFDRMDVTDWIPGIIDALRIDPATYLPEIAGAVVLVWFAVILLLRRNVFHFLKTGQVK